MCYTLVITKRGRKRGHHPKETNAMNDPIASLAQIERELAGVDANGRQRDGSSAWQRPIHPDSEWGRILFAQRAKIMEDLATAN